MVAADSRAKSTEAMGLVDLVTGVVATGGLPKVITQPRVVSGDAAPAETATRTTLPRASIQTSTPGDRRVECGRW